MFRILSSLLIPFIGISISWASAHYLPEAHVATGTLIGSAFLHVGAGVLLFALIDAIIFPWHNLRDMAHKEGVYSNLSPPVHAAFVAGYFTIFAAVLLAFAWAGI